MPFEVPSMLDGSTAVLPSMSVAGSMAPGPPPTTAPLSLHAQPQLDHIDHREHHPVLSSDRSSSLPSSDSPPQASPYASSQGQAVTTSPSEPSPATSADSQSSNGILMAAVPTACLGCRGKHLKCDGHNPCLRCAIAEIDCVYIASRRGYRGPRKANNKRVRSSSPPPSSTLSINPGALGTAPPDSCPMLLGAPRTTMPTPNSMAMSTTGYAQPMSVSAVGTTTMGTTTMGTTAVGMVTTGYTTASAIGSLPAGPVSFSGAPVGTTSAIPSLCAVPSVPSSHLHLYKNPYSNGYPGSSMGLSGNSNMAIAMAQPPVIGLPERCLDAFYHYFYSGHPFVLPKEVLLTLVNDNSIELGHLVAAMRYIGSLYIDVSPARAMFFDEAMRLAYLPSCAKDGFLVQTLIMLIVGLDGSCDQERARQLLADVERIALDIGLNQRDFASTNGRGNPVIEESWRRTWWDLFVVDGMIAGVHRMTNFILFDVSADVALPCEEHQYLAGTIPTPAYIEDFDDQIFTGEEREFSSFAYRVAAARILGRFMRCPPMQFSNDENLEKIESMLSNWRMHLPASKRDALTKHCQLDEMMFQAHFINHACTILLHQPHSQLDSSPTRSVTSCAPHRHIPTGQNFNTHTRHTITAACEISKMVTQAVPLLSHTHFFTCVITLSSIVHLSKWALYYIQDEEDLRQQIRLNIGALQKLSEVWKAANTASGQVKGVAREIYQSKKAQQINPTFWVGFTQEEMINSINTDEGIMDDFNTILPVSTQ